MVNVDTRFYRKDKDLDKGFAEINRVIDGYIRAIGMEACDEALKYDSREEIKFHLGSERRSAVSWYPFQKDSRILEVGGEFGAITGELCDIGSQVIVTESSFFRARAISERYKRRENLEIYAGDVADMEFPYQFDYIIVMNMVDKIGNHAVANDPYLRAFEHLQKFLNEDGKLLLADENLYSILHCQQSEGAFNPWNHVRCLHKQQIISLLKQTGFSFMKFYYPLPGYQLVGRVYSDEELPTAVEWNCLANFNCGDQNFLSANMDMITRLTDNNMFPVLAPAFFIEAGRTDTLSTDSKFDVLFDNNYELPMLGFDWAQHGYSSLEEAIDNYRLRKVQSVTDQLEQYGQQERLKAAILKIDQDNEILKKVLDVELDLLRKLKQVCDKHGLKLYAMYGTLLGAVRNAGIIPGDDDIDVALPREDYNKLLLLESEFSDQYFLQTPANDECFYGGYLKLRNKNTTAIHPQNWWVNCCEGIGIDIFPIDSGFSNVKKEKRKRKKIMHLQRLLYAKAYGYFPDFKDMKLLKWKTYKYLSKLFSREKLAEELNSALADNDGSNEAPFGVYAHYLGVSEPRWLNRKAFTQSMSLSYEDIKLLVPAGWEQILQMLYGDNYMEPYLWCEWKRRHGFYDVEQPYQMHKNQFRGLFRPVPSEDQKIVLFGDGFLYEAYYEKYGDTHKPHAIVSLTDMVIEERVHGMKVMTIDEFLQEGLANIYPVVCAIDIRKAQCQMEKIGIRDYHIFLKVREWILLANYTFALSELTR